MWSVKIYTVELDENGTVNIAAEELDGGSTDNVGITDFMADITTFNCDSLGANEVTLTGTDEAGNTNSCTAIVTVIDAQVPLIDITTVPEDQTALADENNEYVMENFIDTVAFTDNCTNITILQNPAAGTVLNPGIYTVTITISDAGANTDTAAFELTVDSTLSTDDNVKNTLAIYPNPVRNTLYITSEQPLETLKLYDLSGRLVIEAQQADELDVRDLSTGIYLLQIASDNKMQTFKIIKE